MSQIELLMRRLRSNLVLELLCVRGGVLLTIREFAPVALPIQAKVQPARLILWLCASKTEPQGDRQALFW